MSRTPSEERWDRWERDSMRRKMDDALHAVARRASCQTEEDLAAENGTSSSLTYLLHCWLLQLERRTCELEMQSRRSEDLSRRWRSAFVTVSVVALVLAVLSGAPFVRGGPPGTPTPVASGLPPADVETVR